MNPRNIIQSLALGIALTIPTLPSISSGQDLPYNSGSTGADGTLNIPTVFPNLGPRGGAAYHAAENAVYYISSYFVWRSGDGNGWTRIADVPGNYSNYGDWLEGQLAYDTDAGVLYAFVLSFDQQVGDFKPKLFKLAGGNWQAVGTGLPDNSVGSYDYWTKGRLVYHQANQTLILFGVGDSFNQTWTFDGTTWTQQTPSIAPSGRRNPQMAYDPVRNETVLFGGEGASDTWIWNGSAWVARSPGFNPPSLSNCPTAWHPGSQGVVIAENERNLWVWDGSNWSLEHTAGTGTASLSGSSAAILPGTGEMLAIANNRVISMKDAAWSFKTGNPYYIDLKSRPSGVFNYTNILVPSGMNVKFLRNTANTPVIWLASGFVQIDGTVDVSGSGSAGGPGGYDGADGLMVNGQGPGGGYPPDQLGGRYFGVYGNPQIEPLIGGSGGGRTDTYYQAATGGGGAVLIAASRDIQISGSILSNSSYAGQAGSGSGGAIKLVADRILGTGSLQANTGGSQYGYNGTPGRIRIEAYETDMVDNGSPLPSSATSPVWDSGSIASQLEYELKVTHVAGLEVREPPTGQTSSPDVSFSTDQEVTVVVSGRNIPDGTPIKLSLSGQGINTTLPASGEPDVLMQSGGATFNVTIPAGLGNIQASAVFQKPATP
jgi:hypothetical protein